MRLPITEMIILVLMVSMAFHHTAVRLLLLLSPVASNHVSLLTANAIPREIIDLDRSCAGISVLLPHVFAPFIGVVSCNSLLLYNNSWYWHGSAPRPECSLCANIIRAAPGPWECHRHFVTITRYFVSNAVTTVHT